MFAKRLLIVLALAATAAPATVQAQGRTAHRYVYQCGMYKFGENSPFLSRTYTIVTHDDRIALRNVSLFLSAWGQRLDRADIKYSRSRARLVSKTRVRYPQGVSPGRGGRLAVAPLCRHPFLPRS